MNTQIVLTNSDWTNVVQRTYRALIAPSIAFKPAFAKLTGSATAALMLSQGHYWSDGRTTREDGWFFKTADQWTEEICLTRREQEGARKHLRSIYLVDANANEIPIWEEDLRGQPAVLNFRINEVALALALTIMERQGEPIGGYMLVAPDCQVNIAHVSQNVETGFTNMGKLGLPKRENITIYTESTTETTAENGAAILNTANGNGAVATSLPGSDTYAGPSREDILGGRRGYKKQRQPTMVDHAQTCTQQAGEMGLTPQAWVEYYKLVADICGLRAYLDLDESDRALIDLRDGAIRLLRLELRSVEALNALVGLWKEENSWRANARPTLRSLAEFQSKKLQEVQEKAAKNAALDDNPMIEVEEWLIGNDGKGSWWPDTMRRKRYDRLVAEGRKIRPLS